jgi:hypothetical protein
MDEALVDLANICCDGNEAYWDRYLAVKQAWRDLGGGRIRAIGDRRRLHRLLLGGDLARLEQAQRAGEVEVVPFADPHLISRALDQPGLSLISNDRFTDHLREFPQLVGFDRIFRVTWTDDGPDLVRSSITAVEPAVASRKAEVNELRRFGFRPDTADIELLRWDWRCPANDCELASQPQLDELPICDNGVAVCPACDRTLERLAYADGGVELKLAVAGTTLERIALADGSTVVLGRGAQPGHFDVSHLLDDHARDLISRSHLQLENRGGRLRLRDLGSRNGTNIVRPDGSVRALTPDTILFLDEDAVARLADVLDLRRSGRRWPRGRSLASTFDSGQEASGPTRLPS